MPSERRGRRASRRCARVAMAPKYRMAAVKEAPVFHPSAEEFADPLRYIA